MTEAYDDSKPWEKVISIALIMDIYDDVMVRYGGKKSLLSEDCIEGSLGNAHNAELYSERGGVEFGPIFAVHLLVYLARNHCFEDGNKRIAWSCFVYVLSHHRLRVLSDADEVEKLMNDVVAKRLNAPDIMAWLLARLTTRGT
jgi:death on curing protein